MSKPKYFCVSDLHGTHPRHLISALLSEGFENGNTLHKVVVAGDITDGLGHDEKLINCLREYEKAGQLIAVKGNHDIGVLEDRPMNDVDISDESKEGLENLPHQINHKDFYLAHGMYLKKLGDEYDFESTGGSPCLISNPLYEGGRFEEQAHTSLHKKGPTIKDYVKDHDDKPMIIGHFGASKVKERMAEMNKSDEVSFTQDEKGFVSIENIHYVDSDVLHAYPYGTVQVKVL